MILNPSILALLGSSILITLMVLYASFHAVVILRRWDIASGSEQQLVLERRTYLVSTIVCTLLAFQLASLFLFVNTADSICHLFIGAMCAAGTLSVNSFGYPTLLLKLITFILAGLWLILNHADSKGYDYPLIRAKYLLLLLMTPFIVAEAVFQNLYFLGLRPDIITSCCGSLFSRGTRAVTSEILALPALPMEAIFYSGMFLTLLTGGRLLLRGKGGYLFAGMSGIMFLVSLLSVISFISLYIYEMPSHHCPFCVLQREYGYIGYPLYGMLLLSTLAGLGVGMLQPFRNKNSLRQIIPVMQRRLTVVSLITALFFTGMTTWRVLFSSLNLPNR